jgi:hypothetical protein|nr:MAG TPA: hypothetical protein [Caudoviricetes sp.]
MYHYLVGDENVRRAGMEKTISNQVMAINLMMRETSRGKR